MKVILNKDLVPLGEEGDVKDVAKGYARNYLFPRGIALPYNERSIKLFEGRKEQIEARKDQKRADASGLKEKLENLPLEITMPAGPNGKLYGAVTSQTIMDELAKHGFQLERKKIEIPGTHIKNVGKFKVTVKLYENTVTEVSVNVLGQEIKTESPKAQSSRPPRRRRDETRDESRNEIRDETRDESRSETSAEAAVQAKDAEVPEANSETAKTDSSVNESSGSANTNAEPESI